MYKEKNYKGDICVVMEGDKTNFEQSDNEEKETFKFYDFKNSVSSLEPIVDDVCIFCIQKTTIYYI